MKVLFRAEASERIGAGHIMRSLALAQALLDAGHEVQFLCVESSDYFCSLISKMIVPPLREALISGSEADQLITTKLIAQDRIDLVVVDMYAAQTDYVSALRATGACLLVIDDIADRKIDADIVVNQSLGAESLRYDLKNPAKMLLGLEYSLLRREYAQPQERPDRQVGSIRRILLSLGGAPPLNHLGVILSAVFEITGPILEFRIVMGSLSPEQRDMIKIQCEQAKTKHKYVLLPWIDSLYEELNAADLFISAAGSSVFEALTMQTPTALCYFAENQRFIYETCIRQGACKEIGDLRTVSHATLLKILTDICTCPFQAIRIGTLDGLGAKRVVREVANYLKIHR